MEIKFAFNELANYRKKDGFIDLNHFLDRRYMEREVRGNDNRQKVWFNIRDGRAMFKANEEEHNYAHYSELICCGLARQVGLKTAEYDLATFENEQGIITKDMCGPGEELLTLHELIGEDPVINEDYPDSINIMWVFEALEKKLHSDGYSEKDIDSCLLGLRKQLAFDISVMETDRHTENISFIINKDEKTAKQSIRISPIYDTENALVLYNDPQYMKKIYSSILKTANVANLQDPKMCVIPEDDEEKTDDIPKELLPFFARLKADVNEGGIYSSKSEEMWKETLAFLWEDKRVYGFLENSLNCMNIEDAIEEVEAKIGIEIPEDIKKMSIECFNARKDAVRYELGLDIKTRKQEQDRGLT